MLLFGAGGRDNGGGVRADPSSVTPPSPPGRGLINAAPGVRDRGDHRRIPQQRLVSQTRSESNVLLFLRHAAAAAEGPRHAADSRWRRNDIVWRVKQSAQLILPATAHLDLKEAVVMFLLEPGEMAAAVLTGRTIWPRSQQIPVLIT